MGETTQTQSTQSTQPAQPVEEEESGTFKVKCKICKREYNAGRIGAHYSTHIPDLLEEISRLHMEIDEMKKAETEKTGGVIKVKDVKPLLDEVMKHVQNCESCRAELGEWLNQNSKTFAEWFVPAETRKRLRL